MSALKAHVADNGRHGEFEAVIRHGVGPEDDALEVELPVCNDLLQDIPVDFFLTGCVGGFVGGFDAAIGDVAEFEEFRFFGREPFRSSGRVGEEEEAGCAEKDGEDAFEDEDCEIGLVRAQVEFSVMAYSIANLRSRRDLAFELYLLQASH